MEKAKDNNKNCAARHELYCVTDKVVKSHPILVVISSKLSSSSTTDFKIIQFSRFEKISSRRRQRPLHFTKRHGCMAEDKG